GPCGTLVFESLKWNSVAVTVTAVAVEWVRAPIAGPATTPTTARSAAASVTRAAREFESMRIRSPSFRIVGCRSDVFVDRETFSALYLSLEVVQARRPEPAEGTAAAAESARRLLANIEQVVVGKPDEVALVVAACIS